MKIAISILFASAVAIAAAPALADYVIASKHSGMCIEMQGGGATMARCTGNGAQLFKDSGSTQMKQGGKCLVSHAEGKPLVLQACNDGNRDQKWALNGGRLNNNGGWCADVDRASKSAGAHVVAWKCTGASNQVWRLGTIMSASSARLQPAAVSTFQQATPGSVINLASGKVIGNDGGSIVAAGGGNILSTSSGNIVAAGGGNVINFGK